MLFNLVVYLCIFIYVEQQVIENVPPHWRDGLVEEKGSRWSGSVINTLVLVLILVLLVNLLFYPLLSSFILLLNRCR